MSLVTDRVAGLDGYTPGEQPGDDSGLIKLNTNENPYPPSPRVAEAVARECSGLNLYPSPLADLLRDKAAARYEVGREQILAGNGSDELLSICLRACAGEGGAVAYGVPTYSLYSTLVATIGARPIEISVPGQQRWKQLVGAQAGVSIVCSPNSPSGEQVSLDELRWLAERLDAVLLVDEAYVDFGAASALCLLDEFENLVVLRSFSKSFSLAGLRLGLLFAHESLIRELAKVKDSYNVSRLAIAAGAAALDDYGWMEANVARVVATRQRVLSRLREGGYHAYDSNANFFWLDGGAEGGSGLLRRLRERGVLVRYFDSDELRHGVRVSVGTDEQMDVLLAALDC